MDSEINNNPVEEVSTPVPKAGVKKGSLIKKIIWVVIILVLAAAGYLGYTYWQKKRLADPAVQQAQVDKQIAKLTAAVSQVMILPKDEKPTVATINDAAKLKTEQPFYVDAENGDQLLVYTQARKAIIYRPSKNIIINAGPVYVQDEQKTATTPTPAAPKAPVKK